MSAFQTLNTCSASAKGLFTVCEILPRAEQKFVRLPSGLCLLGHPFLTVSRVSARSRIHCIVSFSGADALALKLGGGATLLLPK